VQVTTPGSPSFVEFCAAALSGRPDHLTSIPMSDHQTGVAGRPLSDPLAVAVYDAQGNPVAGVPVDFKVTEGGGSFSGKATARVTTGADGIAGAVLTLGPEDGIENNVATASFTGQNGLPVTFGATGRVPGPVGQTTFRGIVLDNEDRPLENARAVIQGTNREALSDSQGRFLITNVPPGAQRLFVDGSQIRDTQGRTFPNLEFDTNVISGTENSLGMSVCLPALTADSKSMRTITGPVTQAVVLQLPGVPEATLTLLPGTIVRSKKGPASASNPITVSLSRVNSDRVPMPPPNGGIFALAGTVQPAGTQFDPPAALCQPNSLGLRPGAQVDIFSFDHDVGQFVSIGLATVTEDGARICSNAGFGIHKAGWHGSATDPNRTTEVKNPRAVITEIVSAQIPGSECNTFPAPPDKPRNTPMLMGASADGKARILVKTTVDPPSYRPNVLLSVSDSTGHLLATAVANAPSTLLEFSPHDGAQLYHVIGGFDNNHNGTIDGPELGQQTRDVIRVITRSDYLHAGRLLYDIVAAGGAFSTSPVAKEFLKAFLQDQAPNFSGVTSIVALQDVRDPLLDHPVGAVWNADCQGVVRKNVFSPVSDVSRAVAQDADVRTIVESNLRSGFVQEIQSAMSGLPIGGVYESPSLDSPGAWTWKSDGAFHFLHDVDLHRAFGGIAGIDGKMQVKVQKVDGPNHTVRLKLIKVTFSGSFADLYDFAYTDAYPATYAATVQAGYGTLGIAGHIFKSEVDFQGSFVPANPYL
jgi:hypothetical protein